VGELHWATKYIGRPWVKDGDGPDEFNCGGLVRYLYRERLGIEVPTVDVDALSLLSVAKLLKDKDGGLHKDWVKVEAPKDMDAVELSHAKDPHHVGLWLDVDGGGVLHCVQGIGVMFSNPTNLHMSGWKIKGYWRHKCRQ